MAIEKSLSTYLDEKILSRTADCVEKALIFASVIALTAVFSAPSSAENTEPDPTPQLSYTSGAAAYADAKQLMKEHKWVEAVVLLRSALKSSPGSAAIELDLARALAYSGRREEALSALGQMINRKKGPAQKVWIQRHRVLSRLFLTNATFQLHQDGLNLVLAGKYRAAREKFEKALESDPTNVEILTRIGQCLVLDGDVDSAAERLRVARRLNAYEPEIRLWLGRALFERGEMKEALLELKSAYLDLPASENAAVWYAEALFAAGQKLAALEVLDDDVKREANHVLALITLSRYRLMNASPHDSSAAWQVRKDLQLALSRIPLYQPAQDAVVTTNAAPAAPLLSDKPIDAMGDLSLDLRRPATELKHETESLMEEADNRLEAK